MKKFILDDVEVTEDNENLYSVWERYGFVEVDPVEEVKVPTKKK